MPAIECLACGASVYSLSGAHSRCHDCGGEHFHSSLPGIGRSRFPATYHPGDHASLIYRSERRLLDVLVPYIRGGLRLGQSLLGVVDRETRELICAALRSDEVELIEFSAPEQIYGTPFDGDGALERYGNRVADSERPIRAFGGIDRSLASNPETVEQLELLEHGCAPLFESGMTALCLYDGRFCSTNLLDIAASHELLASTDVVHVHA